MLCHLQTTPGGEETGEPRWRTTLRVEDVLPDVVPSESTLRWFEAASGGALDTPWPTSLLPQRKPRPRKVATATGTSRPATSAGAGVATGAGTTARRPKATGAATARSHFGNRGGPPRTVRVRVKRKPPPPTAEVAAAAATEALTASAATPADIAESSKPPSSNSSRGATTNYITVVRPSTSKRRRTS